MNRQQDILPVYTVERIEEFPTKKRRFPDSQKDPRTPMQ
jgi:hypothetical protein